jgi:hypothetical protein
VVTKAFIAQDVFKYDRRWPLRRYWVTSGPSVSIADPAKEIVKTVVRLEFKVQNAQKQVVGSCESTIYIRDASSNPKVISVRSKTLSRQEFPEPPEATATPSPEKVRRAPPVHGPRHVRTYAEYEQVPSGTEVIWPDGTRYRKP